MAAPDLRGYGGSDKPPRGYDLITAASDAAGLVRSLGEANAIVVGHDWGGLIAWTMSAYFPKVVRRLAIVSVPHPLRLRAAVLSDPLGQGRSSGYALGFQLPLLPERQLLRDGAQRVGRMLNAWSGPDWPDARTERRYRNAMRIPHVAHSALEYHRWFLRSRFRPDGLRYARAMRRPIQAPTLHLHGALDGCVLPSAARGSGRYVEAPYRWRLLDGVGHFPHEESPEPLRQRAAVLAGRPRAGTLVRAARRAQPEAAARDASRGTRLAGRRGRAGPGRGRAGAERPAAGRTGAAAAARGGRRAAVRRTRRRCRRTRRWTPRSGCSTPGGPSMPMRCWRRPGRRLRPRSGTCGRAWPSWRSA